MKMYSKQGDEILVDKSQKEILMDAGWTKEKPVKEAVEAVEDAIEEIEKPAKKPAKIAKK